MKNRKQKLWVLTLVLVMLTMPLSGLAAEVIRFEGPIPCERMTLDTVEFRRTDSELVVDILYTLNDNLSAEDKEGLELMSFNLMPNAESTDFPNGFISGSMGAVDRSLGADIVAGETYHSEDTWEGLAAFPETFYLRPFYKFLGEWGEVVALHVADAQAVE